MVSRDAAAALESERISWRTDFTRLLHGWGVDRSIRFTLAVVVACAGYYAACIVGFHFRFPSQRLAANWPANAILAAALMLAPARRWWVLLLAAFPVHLAAYAPHGAPVWEMLWRYLYHWVMAISVAGSLRYFMGERFGLDHLRQMAIFIAVVTLVPGVVALGGASAVLALRAGGSFWLGWRLSYLANLLAFLTIFPAAVMLIRGWRSFVAAPPRRYIEAGLLGAGLISVVVAVFGRQGPLPPALFYAPLPLLLWAAVRFSPAGLCLSLLAVELLSIYNAIAGRGPFFTQSLSENTLSLQVFLIAISIPLLFLAAVIEERRGNEKALRLSQERYKLATSGGNAGVWDWDIESNNLYLDPVLKSILGYEDDESFNQDEGWSRVFHPEDLGHAMERVRACAAGEIPGFELELRFVRKDGSVGWLLDRGKAVRDGDGRVVRLVGTKVDITDRRRATEALRESEERNQAMLRAMPDLMFLHTKDGVYLDYQAKDPSQLYVAPDRFLGKNIREVLGPEVAEVFERSVEGTTRSNEPATHEYTLDRPGENKTHFEWRLVDCGGDRVLSILRDITERRRAEEALRESEERYRSIFESTAVGATEASTDGTIIRVNEAFCRLTGYSREELLGSRFSDITHHEDLEQGIEPVRRMLRGEVAQVTFEKRYVRKDGELVWAAVYAATVRDSVGQPLYNVALINDITDRKRAEQLLRAELGVLTETMPQIVWAARPDGHADYHNHKWYDLTGATEGVTGEESWLPLVHPDDRDGCLDIWRESVRTGSPYQVECRIKQRATGEYRWYLVRALSVRDEKENIVRWVGTNTDIHDQKQAEQTLRESSQLLEHRVAERTGELSRANAALRAEISDRNHAEEALRENERRFRAIFDRAGIAIALVDPSGHPFECNPALVDMLGYSAEELRTMTFAQFTHPDDVDPDLNYYHRLMQGKIDRYRIEKRYLRKGGGIVWANLTVSLVRDGLGQPRFAVGMAEDITERKRAEDELHETQTELAHVARVTALGELAASIAHEVNQPLAAIVGNADICLNWLKSNPSDLEPVREALADILDDGNRAGQVIARIRSLMKKGQAQNKRLDINEVISDVVALVANEAARRHVKLQAELCPRIPPLLGDRVQLQQVLLNLLMNGLEAMDMRNNGRRELLVRSGEYDRAFVAVEVRDSGLGIAPAELERVFTPFYTTKPSGIGMGLSICRSIIGAHGGKLWAIPNPERGAIFQFTLPACVEVCHE